METAAISHRVADFLKQYPPFHVMAEEDLLTLARQGRVKFFEPNEYVLAQGGSRLQVFVIQQGTVSLWDERGKEAKLLDVRGPGDMLGIDQSKELRSHPYAGRSASDVLIYAFPVEEFETIVLKYPDARQFISAYGGVGANSRLALDRRDPENVVLRELLTGKQLAAVESAVSVREAARYMLSQRPNAIAVLDAEHRAEGILTVEAILRWLVDGGGIEEPVQKLMDRRPTAISGDVAVTDAVLALASASDGALAVTDDGTNGSAIRAIVTSQDLAHAFAERPTEILREIADATGVAALRQLNERARTFALSYLRSASASPWLAGFTSFVDASIVRRIIKKEVQDESPGCWCFCGRSGRGESLTKVAPQIIVIADDDTRKDRYLDAYQRVLELLEPYGYLPNKESSFEPSFHVASLAEWTERYSDWLKDPILKQIFGARPLFDLRPIHGDDLLCKEIESAVMAAVNREFLHVLANDCLASLPPLTFFENAVIDESGGETDVFRLEHSVLNPLVDVARVFGIAARKVFGSSTIERLAVAGRLMPERASIFLEASETMRIVLWQQGRVGISQDTAGTEIPPALLSRYERQLLKGGFRSILRLLEFTADMEWVKGCD